MTTPRTLCGVEAVTAALTEPSLTNAAAVVPAAKLMAVEGASADDADTAPVTWTPPLRSTVPPAPSWIPVAEIGPARCGVVNWS